MQKVIKALTIRLRPADLERLRKLQQAMGGSSYADIVRMALQHLWETVKRVNGKQ